MFLLQSQGPGSWTDTALHIDQWLMLKLNRDMQSPALDLLALFSREAVTWAPLYLFLIVFMVMNQGNRGWWWVVAAMALVGISDLVSSHVIKDLFDRPRPCRDPYMSQLIRFIARTCGTNGSFVSSHASNHFTMATFIHRTLGSQDKRWSAFFLWAILVSWAQVYVGVHYPSDVIGGALLGSLIGYLGSRFFNRKIGLTNFHTA
jgi:membrane-associated phospholipid phosphatase